MHPYRDPLVLDTWIAPDTRWLDWVLRVVLLLVPITVVAWIAVAVELARLAPQRPPTTIQDFHGEVQFDVLGLHGTSSMM